MSSKICDISKTINSGIYVIVYSEKCWFSRQAVELLDKSGLKHKKYRINGDHRKVIDCIHQNKDIPITPGYRTIPLIWKDNVFVGGHDTLNTLLSS
jgi:glutaredoxin